MCLSLALLVLYYLNMDNIINSDFVTLARFIADKENGFVTFFIKNKLLESMIGDVLQQGGDPPVNKIRKVIFKDFSGLDLKKFERPDGMPPPLVDIHKDPDV